MMFSTDENEVDKTKAIESKDIALSTGSDESEIYNNYEYAKTVNKPEPVRLTPIVQDYSDRSPQNAAAIKDDHKSLSILERIGGSLKSFNRSDENRDLNEEYLASLLDKTHPNISSVLFDKRDVTQRLQYIHEKENEMSQIPDYAQGSLTLEGVSALSGMAGDLVDTASENYGKIAVGGVVGLGLSAIPATAVNAIPIVGQVASAAIAGSGFLSGTALTYHSINALNMAKTSAGAVVRSAMIDKNPAFVGMADEDLANLSLGVGAIAGGLEFALTKGYSAAKKLGQIVSGKTAKTAQQMVFDKMVTNLLDNPTLADKLIKVGRNVGQGSLINSVQDFASFYAEEGAKDGNFFVTDYTPDQWVRLLDRQIVGVGTSVAASGIAYTYGYGKQSISNKIDNKRSIIQRAKDAIVPPTTIKDPTIVQAEILLSEKHTQDHSQLLSLKDSILAHNEVESKLTIKDSAVIGEIKNHTIPMQNVFINPVDIEHMSDRQKAQLEKSLGITLGDDVVQIPLKQAVDISKTNPELLDHIVADVSQNSLTATKELVNRVEAKRSKLEILKNNLKNSVDPKEIIAIQKNITEIEKLSDYSYDTREEYKNRPMVDSMYEHNLDPKVMADMESARNKSIQEATDAINEESRKTIKTEMNVMNEHWDVKSELDLKDNDSRIATSVKFTDSNYKPTGEVAQALKIAYPEKNLSELKDAHHGVKESSPLAIDPRTLPEDLQHLAQDKRLKKHGVFKKGGFNFNGYDEVAKALGHSDAQSMLEHLTYSDTKQELLNKMFEKNQSDAYDVAVKNYSPNEQTYVNKLKEAGNLALKEFKHRMENKPTGVLKQISQLGKNIYPSDNKKSLSFYVDEVIQGTKYSDLRPEVFRKNNESHGRKAAEQLSKGNILESTSHKYRQAFNILSEVESFIQKKSIDGKLKYIKKNILSSDGMQILDKAGPKYIDIVNEIKDIIDFNPKKNNINAQQLLDSIQSMIGRHEQVDINIDIVKDIKLNVRDLTVEQVHSLADLTRSIFENAKNKNKISTDKANDKTTQTIDNVRSEMTSELTKKPGYDSTRYDDADIDNGWLSNLWTNSVQESLGKASAHFNRFSFIAEKLGPTFNKLIVDPLFKSENHSAFVRKQFKQKLAEKLIAILPDYRKLERNIVVISELAKINNESGKQLFKDGKVTEAQLLSIGLNSMNENNRQWLRQTLGKSDVEITKILETHLTDKHFEAIAEIGKFFAEELNPYRKEQLRKNNRNIAPDKKLEGSVKFNGKEYSEMYYPVMTNEMLMSSAELMSNSIDVGKMMRGDYSNVNSPFTDTTFNTHNIEATGASKFRNLSFDLDIIGRTIDSTVHDSVMYQPTSDALKVLSDPEIQKHIVNTVGMNNYQFALLEPIGRLVKNQTSDSHKGALNTMLKYLYGSSSAHFLGYNKNTLLNQMGSVPLMATNLIQGGDNGIKYFTNSLARHTLDPLEMYRTINEIVKSGDPEFVNKFEKEIDLIPSKMRELSNLPENMTLEQYNNAFQETMNTVVGTGLTGLRHVSLWLNTVHFDAAYQQAINGDAHGVKGGDSNAALEYANKQNRMTLETESILDRPSYRYEPLAMLIGGFMLNQGNLIYNNVVHRGVDKAFDYQANITKKEFLQGVSTALAATMAGSALTMTLKQVLSEQEDISVDEFIIESGLKDTFGANQLIRDYKNYDRRDTRSSNVIVQMGQLGSNIIKGLTKNIKEDADFTDKQAEDYSRLIGMMTGAIPAKGVKLFTGTVLDLVELLADAPNEFQSDDPVVQNINAEVTKYNETETDPRKKRINNHVINLTSSKTLRDNSTGNFITVRDSELPVEITSEDNAAIKVGTEVIKQYRKNFDHTNTMMDQSAWSKIVLNYPELHLPEDIKKSSEGDQYKAAWKYYGEIAGKLKTAHLDVSLDNMYAAQIFGDNFTAFEDLKGTDQVGNLTKGTEFEGTSMTKDELLTAIQSNLGKLVEPSVNIITSEK